MTPAAVNVHLTRYLIPSDKFWQYVLFPVVLKLQKKKKKWLRFQDNTLKSTIASVHFYYYEQHYMRLLSFLYWVCLYTATVWPDTIYFGRAAACSLCIWATCMWGKKTRHKMKQNSINIKNNDASVSWWMLTNVFNSGLHPMLPPASSVCVSSVNSIFGKNTHYKIWRLNNNRKKKKEEKKVSRKIIWLHARHVCVPERGLRWGF